MADDDLDLDETEGTEHEDLPSAEDLGGMAGWLDEQIDEQRTAGQDTYSLNQVRKALRKQQNQIAAAERRGFERARQELGPQLQAEQARERNLRRLAVPPELEPAFQDLNGDGFDIYRQRAAELAAKGIRWDAPPSGPVVDEQARQAARDQAIASTVTQSMQTQAGGLPANSQPDLQQRAQAARQRPGGPSPEEAWAIAQELNADLDALARHAGGEW